MISRRRFFRRAFGAVIAAAGAIQIVPGVTPVYHNGLDLAALDRVARARVLPGVIDNFFKSDPLLAYLKARETASWKGPTL